MIAVVHGPRGCGKSTALRTWLARRGWLPPRGFRTFFSDGTLRLATWEDGATPCTLMRKTRSPDTIPPPSRPKPPRSWNPDFAPALHAFLDALFYPPPDTPPPVAIQIQPPVPAHPEHLPSPATVRPPFPFDAPAFWHAALSNLDADSVRPLVIDELGLLETLPGALDPDALRRLLDAVHSASRAILVVQDRALPFWLRELACT